MDQERLGTPVTRKNVPLSVGELLPCGRCAALQVALLQGDACRRSTRGTPVDAGRGCGALGPVGALRGQFARRCRVRRAWESAHRREGAELLARGAASRCASRTASRLRGWALGCMRATQGRGRAPGMFVKLHHSIADGMAAMTTIAAFLDADPDAPITPASPWTPRLLHRIVNSSSTTPSGTSRRWGAPERCSFGRGRRCSMPARPGPRSASSSPKSRQPERASTGWSVPPGASP